MQKEKQGREDLILFISCKFDWKCCPKATEWHLLKYLAVGFTELTGERGPEALLQT